MRRAFGHALRGSDIGVEPWAELATMNRRNVSLPVAAGAVRPPPADAIVVGAIAHTIQAEPAGVAFDCGVPIDRFLTERD